MMWRDSAYQGSEDTIGSDRHSHDIVYPAGMGGSPVARLAVTHRHDDGNTAHSHIGEWTDLLARIKAGK